MCLFHNTSPLFYRDSREYVHAVAIVTCYGDYVKIPPGKRPSESFTLGRVRPSEENPQFGRLTDYVIPGFRTHHSE